MSKVDAQFPAAKPDLVAAFMRQVIAMAPGFSAALASQIEADFRDDLTRMTDAEIMKKHSISRSTLARIMKGL